MLKWKEAGCLTCKWNEREGEVRVDITQCHINKRSSHDGVLNAECESTAAAFRWHFSIAFKSKKKQISANLDWSQRDSFREKKEGWMQLILMCNDYSISYMTSDHPSTVWPCASKWTIKTTRTRNDFTSLFVKYSITQCCIANFTCIVQCDEWTGI